MRPRELRPVMALAFGCVALVFSACGGVDKPSPSASPRFADASSSESARASATALVGPTADPSPHAIYVNEVHGWSISVPPGWEVVTNSEGSTMVVRGEVITEILVFPASGLTLEQLQAKRVGELRAWPGMDAVEAEIVRLPVGEATRTTLEMTHPNGDRGVFVSYAIEERGLQYVISVRGPRDDGDLLADAAAFAESFALTGDESD